jgi:hypothetical protein
VGLFRPQPDRFSAVIFGCASPAWRHRAHFFAVSARIMRHILLDAARSRASAKRGGNYPRIDLNEIPDIPAGAEAN